VVGGTPSAKQLSAPKYDPTPPPVATQNSSTIVLNSWSWDLPRCPHFFSRGLFCGAALSAWTSSPGICPGVLGRWGLGLRGLRPRLKKMQDLGSGNRTRALGACSERNLPRILRGSEDRPRSWVQGTALKCRACNNTSLMDKILNFASSYPQRSGPVESDSTGRE
jgi:hypothetical protein